MKYKIAIHRTEEGISVSVPALPGCWSEGDTEDRGAGQHPGCHPGLPGRPG